MMFFLLASLCSLFSLVFAFPVASPVKRDVWAPMITYPTSTTVWTAGCTYNVTWDTSNQPVNITNPDGLVYLRHGVDATEESVLAEGFLLTDGAVDVTIPADTQPDTDWIVMRKSIL